MVLLKRQGTKLSHHRNFMIRLVDSVNKTFKRRRRTVDDESINSKQERPKCLEVRTALQGIPKKLQSLFWCTHFKFSSQLPREIPEFIILTISQTSQWEVSNSFRTIFSLQYCTYFISMKVHNGPIDSLVSLDGVMWEVSIYRRTLHQRVRQKPKPLTKARWRDATTCKIKTTKKAQYPAKDASAVPFLSFSIVYRVLV